MTERAEYIASLIRKDLLDTISIEEKRELDNWINESASNKALYNRLVSSEEAAKGLKKMYSYNSGAMAARIEQEFPGLQLDLKDTVIDEEHYSSHSAGIRYLRHGFMRYAAAALILIVGAVVYFYFSQQKKSELVSISPESAPVILPGGNKAILTLSNGRQVILNDSSQEQIADGSTYINKNNGVLIYDPALTSEVTTTNYNTMLIPRGGQYQLVLPDGSKVWLNSASSLKYPVIFRGAKREVELTGEAYFEVKENRTKPFIVKTKNTSVTVLGTEFNVNSYEDEPLAATTLVKGSVKVKTSADSTIIKPGQQASANYSDSRLQVSIPKMEEVLAWRMGTFKFYKAPIQTIMRQISRWYDVDVVYKGNVSNIQLSGSLLRTDNLSVLLDAIEFTDDLYFVIEGKRITVNAGKKPKP